MTTDLCFPVLKYSHALGIRADNSIPWIHVSAADIFVIVKGNGSALSMRIVQGTSVLESVNVGQYIEASTDARRGADQDGIFLQIEQLPIFGITKESLLALRYRLSNDQARRVQLRLQKSADCSEIVHCFQSKGMEFQQQRPRTGRPTTALDRPSSSTTQRLPSSYSSSSHFNNIPSRALKPFHLPEASPGTQVRRPTTMANDSQSPERTPAMPSWMEGPNLRPFVQDDNASSRHLGVSPLTDHQLYSSLTTPFANPMPDAVPSQPAGEATNERLHPVSRTVDIPAVRTPVEDDTPSQMAGLATGHTSAPLSYSEQRSSVSAGQGHTLLFSSSDLAEPRPITALSSTSATAVPVTAEPDIPPRRELPFKRPASQQSSGALSSSRPGSAVPFLPPLKRPKPLEKSADSHVRATTTSSTKPGSALRPASVAPRKQQLDAEPTRPTTSGVNLQLSSPQNLPAPTQTVSVTEIEDSGPPRPIDEILRAYDRNALTERTANSKINRMDSLADAPHEIESPTTTAQSCLKLSPSKAPTRDDPIGRALTAFQKSTSVVAESSLPEYSSLSIEDRQAFLDEFMLEKLNDPNFSTLCGDIENCWRRITLGL